MRVLRDAVWLSVTGARIFRLFPRTCCSHTFQGKRCPPRAGARGRRGIPQEPQERAPPGAGPGPRCPTLRAPAQATRDPAGLRPRGFWLWARHKGNGERAQRAVPDGPFLYFIPLFYKSLQFQLAPLPLIPNFLRSLSAFLPALS